MASIKKIITNGKELYLDKFMPEIFEELIKSYCHKVPNNIDNYSIYLYPKNKYKHKKVYILKHNLNNRHNIIGNLTLEELTKSILDSLDETQIYNLLLGSMTLSDFLHLFSFKSRRNIKNLIKKQTNDIN